MPTCPSDLFTAFFSGAARSMLLRAVDLAFDEDGRDLTSEALFAPDATLHASIRVKQNGIIAGLPLIPLLLERCAVSDIPAVVFHACDGEEVHPGRLLAEMHGPTLCLLKAERVLLNFLGRLSGIATMTRIFADNAARRGLTLIDTRKTAPGLRYPDKYAVRIGGGKNHRLNLEQMLMLKDNHIDAAGSITKAVTALRRAYAPCPPIEVECRTEEDVREAVLAGADRIMLDNMDADRMAEAAELVPLSVELELSGGIDIHSLSHLHLNRPAFVSAGRITHSAPSLDIHMTIDPAM